MISVSGDWMETCPDARLGIIVLEGVQNTKGNKQLDRKRRLRKEKGPTKVGPSKIVYPAVQDLFRSCCRFRTKTVRNGRDYF